MPDGWTARGHIEATHQETPLAVRLAKEGRWDADQWLDACIFAGVAFCITWAALDVATCLAAYEALGPKYAVAYNPQCA